jgi:hypothetical protein
VAAPFIGGGPVWDDATLIAGRLVVLDTAGIAQLWSGPITLEGPGATYYRPLALSVMALVGRWGIPALHVLALIAHAVSAGLMVHLCRRARTPIWAGLVFALHPLASEVLGWASALPDALAVCLGLLAVLAGGGVPLFLAVVAGALCKETALLIPLCFGLAGTMREGWWRWWVGAAIVVLGLRYAVDVQPPAALWQKLQLVPAALGWNLSSIAWPFPLSAVRDVRLAPGWTGWVGGLVILGVVVGAGRRRAAWAGIGLLILAPALALPTVLDGYLVAERYMYPALVGLGLWAAHVLPGPRRASEWAGAGLVGALCLGSSVHRAPAWQSDQALFQAATAAEPESSLAWHLLGMTYLRRGASLDAADAFGRAVASGHPYPGDRTHKLRALVEADLPEEALAWAEAGPKEGLSAVHLAWWARAAFEAGQRGRAADLLAVLRTPGGLDGPAWLRDLAVQIDKSDSGTDQEADQGP